MVMYRLVILLMIFLGVFFSKTAQADPTVMKAYKVAYPNAKLDCISCHLPSFPWQHPWNAYGKTVKKAINIAGVGEVPTQNDVSKIADVFKKIGKVEDFKKVSIK